MSQCCFSFIFKIVSLIVTFLTFTDKLSLLKLVVLICELCSCNDLLASLYNTVFWRTRCQSSDAEFMFNESAALSFSKFLLNQTRVLLLFDATVFGIFKITISRASLTLGCELQKLHFFHKSPASESSVLFLSFSS